MSEPTLHFVNCSGPAGEHRLAWWQWGDPAAAHVVVCVHGLTRQGRDFDALARALLARATHPLRIVCVDIPGRGRSDWLADPTHYQVPFYAGDMVTLITTLHAHAPVASLDWVGTSMGGLIGLAVAGSPGSPVRRLVLNDVGPVLEWQALQRIGTYVGKTGRFDSIQQAADAMWAISSSFGPHTPAQWLALSSPMVKPLADGGFTLHYDPAIAVPFRTLTPESAAQGEAALWQLYDAIRARTLIIRGSQSDLLSHATAVAMTQRGPRARLVEFDGVGHAPTFIAPEQVEVVAAFLLDESSSDEKPDTGPG